MKSSLEPLISAILAAEQKKESVKDEVIAVSETVSAAASAYESLRNTLEYDEEHLLRRNAIRRILKRRMGEEDAAALANDLLRELIWARYLPNNTISEKIIDKVALVFKKFQPLFERLNKRRRNRGKLSYDWLLDLISTEVEYLLVPARQDEALASFAYQELKKRLVFKSALIAEKDRDLQLYVAVHRAYLKSNIATLRFRIFTLYYPRWITLTKDDDLIGEITSNLDGIADLIEAQISHRGADAMFRLVRHHTFVFHILRDIAQDNPMAFAAALEKKDLAALDRAITQAADERYSKFQTRLRRGVVRAVLFLFFTKMVVALLIEWPYERLVLKVQNLFPLATNILFHPLLLGFIGLTVSIPEKRNTEKLIEEIHAVLDLGQDFSLTYKTKRSWARGGYGVVFQGIYAIMFLMMIGLISFGLYSLSFNWVSILFFLFFLSLVTFFGLKIRNTRRELLVIETASGAIGMLVDIMFLPIVRLGRWMALRAPRINIFLFFFDFIVEAPFKAAIRLIEGWLAYLREKKEEI